MATTLRHVHGFFVGFLVLLGTTACLLVACTTMAPAPHASDTDTVEIVLLHMNDVYEITPLQNGKVGGLARVATLRQRLESDHPHVLTTLGGDFVSPSALGTAKVDGQRLAGKQMIEVLNALDLDVATLGNHEFDIPAEQLATRVGESDFAWVSGNVTWASGPSDLQKIERTMVFPFEDRATGRTVRVGVVGAMLQGSYGEGVTVSDPIESLIRDAEALRPEVDLVVALTHLDLEEDVRLSKATEAIDLILGGHEHANWTVRQDGPPAKAIFKADANARTVWVIRVTLGGDGIMAIDPELVSIGPSLPEDPETQAAVDRWKDAAFDAFRDEGFEPEEVVTEVPRPLDGREAVVRVEANELTRMIADGFLAAASREVEGVQAAIYNSGSIRIDDILPAGVVTQYDVIRLMPFGGYLEIVELPGGLLRKILDQGEANRGKGGFLQWSGIERARDGWLVASTPLDDAVTYRVAFNDFLLTGREAGLAYLKGNPEIRLVQELTTTGEVRQAVIAEMESRYPLKP